MKIQMAKTGKHKGTTIKKQQLVDCVETFSKQDKAPIILGHDSSWNDSMPAMGWVESVEMDGNYLIGVLTLSDEMQELYDSGEYKNWSIGIGYNEDTGKYYIHHLAFLGAVPPKITGLKVIEMGDVAELTLVTCSDMAVLEEEEEEPEGTPADDTNDKPEDDDMTLTKEQIAEMQAENAKLKKDNEDKDAKNLELSDKLKKEQKKVQDAEIAAFCDSLKGKVSKDNLDKVEALLKPEEGDMLLFSDTEKPENTKGLLAVLTEAFADVPNITPDGAMNFSNNNGEGVSARIVIPANKF
jgi:hypothetical protein